MNLSTFLLQSLKAERCDAIFWEKIAPAHEAFQNKDSFLVGKQRTQNPSKSLKKPLLRQKDDNVPQVG